MLKINKKVEYALMALRYMAEKESNELTSAREICDHFGIPFDTTAKVMQAMNLGAILHSVKGVKGGYTLARSLEQINYRELSIMIEGEDILNFCQTSKGTCSLYSTCNIVSPIDQLQKRVNEYLGGLNLAELLHGDCHEMKDQPERSA